MSRLKDICIDCADPWPLAHWWAEVLGYQVRPYTEADLEALRDQGFDDPRSDPNVAVDPVGEEGPTVWFNRVPEPAVGKNRIHLDVYGDVDELVRHGAVVVRHLERWTVLADPEGNLFCAFADQRER
jgi:hypothetical protein